jgi:type VI secretion system secreted protein Hcp
MASTAAETKIYAGSHSDFFMKLGDIKGESTDSKHKGEIDIESWSFGAAQPGASAVSGRGAGVGKVQFGDFAFTKYTDAASPKLMLSCASGQHFTEATFTARRAGGTQAQYLQIKMTDVLVSSFETHSHGEGGATGSTSKASLPIDSVALNFSKIEVNYKAQNPDGSEGANTSAGWNLKENTKV